MVTLLVCGVLALLCAVGAVWMGRMAVQQRKMNIALDNSAKVIKGTLLSKEEKDIRVSDSSRGPRTIREYFVTYRYDYDGKSFTNRRPCTESSYKAWNEGQSIDLALLPEHPENSRLLGDSFATNFPLTLLIGSITLGLAAIALIVIAIVFSV